MEVIFDIKKEMGDFFQEFYRLNCPVRYRVLYGARNTKKSRNCAVEILDKIITSPKRNVTCFRAFYTDIERSIFNELRAELYRTGLFIKFKVKTSPFQITYKETGQQINFSGCDRGTSNNSNQVPFGEITDYYFEEAFELQDYQTFRQIDGSLRGQILNDKTGIPKQITLMLNGWQSEGCWVYDVFVKGRLMDDDTAFRVLESCGRRLWLDKDLIIEKGKGLFLMQCSYLINEFRDKEIYDLTAKEQKNRSIDIYKVEYLGFWGKTGEMVYTEMNDSLILPRQEIANLNYKAFYIGIDTGYSNGEGKTFTGSQANLKIHSAFTIELCGLTSERNEKYKNTIVALNEYYYSHELGMEKMTQPQLLQKVVEKIYEWVNLYQGNNSLFKTTLYVFVDSADAGSLTALQEVIKRAGLFNVQVMSSTKFKINTRVAFTRLLMSWGEMRFSEACPQLIREFKSCRSGENGKVREDINDHGINGFEYATAPMYSLIKKWNTFKIR